MDRLVQDVRYAVRSLVGSPLVTAAAALSLALGTGAFAAIFAAVDHFMFRPLDYEGADELVAVWTTDTERGWTSASSSVPDYVDWRSSSRTLELAAYTRTGLNLSGTDQPERLNGYRISHNFFDVLRERPLLGRTFRQDEEQPGRSRVAILGEGVWRRSFGGDPSVVGGTLRLDGEPYEIIGVMPGDFSFGGSDQDIWVPFTFTGEELRGSRFLRVVGRLRDGSTVESAERELEQVQARLAGSFPESNANKGANVLALQEEWFDEGFRQGSLISATAVLFVLLIACANVTNLLLARGASRSREIALRVALGAGRGRIARQLLTESLVLALAGGAFGVGLGHLGVRGIKGLFPPFLPGVEHLALNERGLLIALAATIAAGLVSGLAPTLQASRPDVKGALAEGGRSGGSSRRGGRMRKALVAGEVALSVTLLVSAVLLVKAYAGVRSNDLGYRVEDVVTLRLSFADSEYDDEEALLGFQRDLLERVRAVPGVSGVGAAHALPMQGGWSTSYQVVGEEEPAEGRQPIVSYRIVTPGYFETMDISLLQGRLVDDGDVSGAPAAMVVNELFASRHWGERSPLGQRVEIDGLEREIVGVVEATRPWGPDSDPQPFVYLSAWQEPVRALSVVAHTAVDPAALVATVREEVRAMDPDQPVYAVSTLAEITREEMSGNMAMVKVLGALALIAFVLAAVGVYGVMAYTVTQRTREMGVRVALGAQARDVRRLVVRQGMLLAGVGIAGGVAVALLTTRALAFFLFGLSPYDPVAFGSVTAMLLVTALAASWIPAVRATRVDPVEVLST